MSQFPDVLEAIASRTRTRPRTTNVALKEESLQVQHYCTRRLSFHSRATFVVLGLVLGLDAMASSTSGNCQLLVKQGLIQ